MLTAILAQQNAVPKSPKPLLEIPAVLKIIVLDYLVPLGFFKMICLDLILAWCGRKRELQKISINTVVYSMVIL